MHRAVYPRNALKRRLVPPCENSSTAFTCHLQEREEHRRLNQQHALEVGSSHTTHEAVADVATGLRPVMYNGGVL